MDPVVPPPAPPVDTTPAAVPVVAEPAPAAVPVEGGLTLPPEAPPAAVHSSEDGVILLVRLCLLRPRLAGLLPHRSPRLNARLGIVRC